MLWKQLPQLLRGPVDGMLAPCAAVWLRGETGRQGMTDSALFIGWGATAAGRERKAVELFGESLRYLTGLVVQGRVASVEPFFLEPHGGDLEGFFLVRGGRASSTRSVQRTTSSASPCALTWSSRTSEWSARSR